MCVPGCQEAVLSRLSRRGFFKGTGMAAAAGAAAAVMPAAPARASEPRSFSRVVDLTHTMGEDFPTFGGGRNLEFETVTRLDRDGYTMYRWLLVEHTGTHMDAPLHFADGVRSADEIPAEDLVLPLVVVDIAGRAEDDADAQLTPDDLAAWEAAHGPIPDGACVAMHSGWQRHLGTDRFRNADDGGTLHFPGFHAEAAAFLMESRDVRGIAVDTMSLDYGRSADFAVHYSWLPSNRWGLEAVANLADVPASGATIVTGAPKVRGATGGPTRLIALV